MAKTFRLSDILYPEFLYCAIRTRNAREAWMFSLYYRLEKWGA